MNHKGFTLLEVLLSLFITAILITILSVVFNTGLRSYRQGKDLLEITRKGQLILGQMTRELSGAMVQNGYIPFVGTDNGNSDSVYFMAPVDNSSPLDLCEIGYSHDSANVNLRRYFLTYGEIGSKNADFQYPDYPVTYPSGVAGNVFCTNVTSFNLQYNNGTSWQPSWISSTTQLPTMIEVSVTIQGEYGNPPQSKTFTTWIYLPNSTNNP